MRGDGDGRRDKFDLGSCKSAGGKPRVHDADMMCRCRLIVGELCPAGQSVVGEFCAQLQLDYK